MKKCRKCSIDKQPRFFHKNKSKSCGLSDWCKKCRKIYDQAHKHDPIRKIWYINNNKRRNINPKTRAKRLHDYAKRRANDKNQKFSLSLKRIENALLLGICERTKIKFVLEQGNKLFKVNPFAPSIDKIDSKKGYSDSNIQVVVWCYNMGKQEMSDKNFIKFCKAVVDNNLRCK